MNYIKSTGKIECRVLVQMDNSLVLTLSALKHSAVAKNKV